MPTHTYMKAPAQATTTASAFQSRGWSEPAELQRTQPVLDPKLPRPHSASASFNFGQVSVFRPGSAGPDHAPGLRLSGYKIPVASRPIPKLNPNRTGLPDGLKAGVEALSGLSLDDVRVHRNSAKPAQLQALAYTQGTNIHVGPGQERHLPHEAWHVVQQAQGRVQPTLHAKGQGINANVGLEREADQMSIKAGKAYLNLGAMAHTIGNYAAVQPAPQGTLRPHNFCDGTQASRPIQCKTYLSNADENIYADSKTDQELSFIGVSGGNNLPLFILYENFKKLKTYAETGWEAVLSNPYAQINKKVLSRKSGPDTKPYQEAYENAIRQIFRGDVFAKVDNIKTFFEDVVGPVYYENEKGELAKMLINRNTWTLLEARLADAAIFGPLYRNVGGGSRLPRAEGTLVIFHPDLRMKSIKEAIGIDPEDPDAFSDVKEMRVLAGEEFSQLLAEAKLQGGHVIDESQHGFFYSSKVIQIRSKHARFIAADKHYDKEFSTLDANPNLLQELKTSFLALQAPVNKGWQKGTELSRMNREDGQAAAMNKWNALGAAAFARKYYKIDYPLDRNWEWLHVQGAQIGGETQQGNLVAGTFMANSEMIPFESQIAKWANMDAKALEVEFSADTGRHVLPTWIKIRVAADNHKVLGTITHKEPLEVTFNPHSTQVVDKFSGALQAKQRELQMQSRQVPLEYIISDVEMKGMENEDKMEV